MLDKQRGEGGMEKRLGQGGPGGECPGAEGTLEAPSCSSQQVVARLLPLT